MNNRHVARLTLACVALALVAAFGAGAAASRRVRGTAAAAPPRAAAAPPQTFVLTDFGAVGDGVTDNGPALQAALDALAAAGGGTLQVPAGRYAIVTPVSKTFDGSASVTISGVASSIPAPPHTAGGEELTRGLGLTSEFLPRTGEAAAAVYVGGLRSLVVEELAFVGTAGVWDDALYTLYVSDVGEAVVRHSEFYGLSSMYGAVVIARRSSLRVERSVFLGCATSSGVYASVVQNSEWKSFAMTETAFTDYGQRPELYGKMDMAAPWSWVNLSAPAPVTSESPRREAVFRNVFFDEGALSAISSMPRGEDPNTPTADLLHVSGLRVNVSNLRTSGLYLEGLKGALVEDALFGWSTLSDTAAHFFGTGSAVLARVNCEANVTTVRADAETGRLVAVNLGCPQVASEAGVTRVFDAASPDADPTLYVRSRFQSALGREPDAAAHFYWADRLLRCDANAACATAVRAALAAYLASNPQATFTLEGRASDETGAPLPGVGVTLSGSQAAATETDADGRYRFSNLPTSGVYTVAAAETHYVFASPSQTLTTPAGARVVNFAATLNRHSLGGVLYDQLDRPVQGVTVTLSGGRTATATTDAGGVFSFAALPAGLSYTVTPSSARHSFQPVSRAYPALGADQFDAYTGTQLFFSVTAQVFTDNNAPVPGVRVSLSGSKTASGATDSKGLVTFADLPRGGSYTVTPGPVVGFTFPGGPQTFNNLTADQGHAFFAKPTSHRLSGRVTAGGTALAGVTLTLSGSQAGATTTDANGEYSFSVPANGDFIVTPSRRHYTFAPAASALNAVTGDRAADFAATINRHRIAGRVARANGQAMAGVTLTLSGAQTAAATTDANGDYSFANLPAGGDYVVTPSKAGYDFAPASRAFADLGADQGASFVVSPANYTLAGRVTSGGAALAGVTMTLTGSRSATATTDASGAYSFGVTSEGAYTVTPSKQHYTFAPQGLTFSDPLSNKTADFAATLNRHKIEGRVTRANGQALPGVTVALSGAQSQTATTDSAGNYVFPNLPAGGDYTVTPSRPGYDINPKGRSFAGLGANQTADFTATALNVNVGGRVTANGAALEGVTMTLTGARSATATTDANGAYSFNVSVEGSYTVTPSKRHYTFAPQGLTFDNPVADRAADFAATLNRHRIAGRVANANNYGLAGVAVALRVAQTGAQVGSAVTDANGEFAFNELAGGGDYTVTPSLPTYEFTPASRVFNDIAADARADFLGQLAAYRLSGRVTEQGSGLAGVTVELSGSHPSVGAVGAQVVTAADGAYSFSVPAGGDYALRPSKKNYTFAPPSAAFEGLAAGAVTDFAATPLPTFAFAAESYEVKEEGGSVLVTVTRNGDVAGAAEVVYQALGDTARRGADFLASIGRLHFAPGETSKTFEVFITDDAFVEGAERFTLTLTPGAGAASGDAASGDAVSAPVVIADNDSAAASANPVDADEFFIRQHYRDFFSREPDADGLAFWKGELARCGADAACREARRVSVSAAFFLSIEFQETGFLVYRLYRASHGRAPERVGEFMLDARVMGEGVVVGRAGWQERLEANKASFILDFVERPQFAARYPETLTPAQFVGALFAAAGVTPTDAERQQAVADFSGAATSADAASRASALRRVAEHAALGRQETDRAFVLMQYFGYLRRNPDEAPDTSLAGYNHWLGKLVEFGGDYEKAEMVKAFLSSAEYRGRFGN